MDEMLRQLVNTRLAGNIWKARKALMKLFLSDLDGNEDMLHLDIRPVSNVLKFIHPKHDNLIRNEYSYYSKYSYLYMLIGA